MQLSAASGVLVSWCPGHPGAPVSRMGDTRPRMAIHTIACSSGLAVFGLSVADVLSDAAWEPSRRDLDVLEVWSGVGSVVTAATSQGLAAAGFDRIHGPDQDLTTDAGFRKVLASCVRLRPGGLLFMAPVCSSFTFPNISNTKRSKTNYAGDTSYPKVGALSLAPVHGIHVAVLPHAVLCSCCVLRSRRAT
jgi:hypothetical protein